MIPKTIVLFFPELVSKRPTERENGARMGEIRGYVPMTLRIMKSGEITSSLHEGRPRFPWIHRSESPSNLLKWILQWCPVLANLHNTGIFNTETSPDTIPGINPELPYDRTRTRKGIGAAYKMSIDIGVYYTG